MEMGGRRQLVWEYLVVRHLKSEKGHGDSASPAAAAAAIPRPMCSAYGPQPKKGGRRRRHSFAIRMWAYHDEGGEREPTNPGCADSHSSFEVRENSNFPFSFQHDFFREMR